MRVQLKPLAEQVVVVTGASSGIGRTTARLAGEAGARVVLAARDREALDSAAEAVVRAGGRAEVVVCDVSDAEAVGRLAARAREVFGGVDTWVNNAGTGIYGTLEAVPLEELRRLMDVNFWGTVYGARAAVPLLEARGGGALVNVGSVLSDRAIPLQGMYCATKHAVKAFTDALRMELAHREAPISVSLVKPATIDTPFYDTSRNHMATRQRPIPPVYAPEVPARAILACATQPIRELYAGGAGVVLGAAEGLAPGVTDRVMEEVLFTVQQSDEPPHHAEGNLGTPLDRGAERGRYAGPVLEHSAYTAAVTRAPFGGRGVLVAAMLGVVAAAAGAGWRAGRAQAS